jgi:hypothetical protein
VLLNTLASWTIASWTIASWAGGGQGERQGEVAWDHSAVACAQHATITRLPNDAMITLLAEQSLCFQSRRFNRAYPSPFREWSFGILGGRKVTLRWPPGKFVKVPRSPRNRFSSLLEGFTFSTFSALRCRPMFGTEAPLTAL